MREGTRYESRSIPPTPQPPHEDKLNKKKYKKKKKHLPQFCCRWEIPFPFRVAFFFKKKNNTHFKRLYNIFFFLANGVVAIGTK